MTVLFVYVAADLFAGVSSPLQKRVQCVEAFKAPSQDFFVGQSLLCPTFENTIDPDRFNSLKSGIVQIGVVDHLTNLRDHFVRDRKTPHERLESAVVAMVRELSIKHVKWDRARHSVCTWRDTNFGFRSMNLEINHADPTRSIPGRGRVSHVLPWYCFASSTASCRAVLRPSARRSSMATSCPRALSKKSTSRISRNCRVRRSSSAFALSASIFLRRPMKR